MDALKRGITMFFRSFTGSLALLFLAACVTSLYGQEGVSPTEITIGSCSALTGPSQGLGRATAAGVNTYFAMINDQGGINGRKIHLVSEDDGYDPQKAAGCWERLMAQKPFAVAGLVGTPTSLVHVDLAEKAGVPVVGLFTGAPGLYTPFRHTIFNVRASYADETREQVNGLVSLGKRKIAIIYPDDSFGKAVLDGLNAALKEHGLTLAAAGTYPRQTTQVDGAITTVKVSSPDAVVLVGPYASVAAILQHAHGQGWRPMFLTVSFVGTDELIKAAGADAEGVVVTQVVPPYYLTENPTVALYHRSLAKYSAGEKPSMVGLEGFVDAMVLCEGIKRAGKDLTRTKLVRSLETMKAYDPGLGSGMHITYTATTHKGFNKVIPTVIRGGLPVPFTDWNVTQRK
jgi:ABC-type branched-subunit amino acid transport system substrate-binding protein